MNTPGRVQQCSWKYFRFIIHYFNSITTQLCSSTTNFIGFQIPLCSMQSEFLGCLYAEATLTFPLLWIHSINVICWPLPLPHGWELQSTFTPCTDKWDTAGEKLGAVRAGSYSAINWNKIVYSCCGNYLNMWFHFLSYSFYSWCSKTSFFCKKNKNKNQQAVFSTFLSMFHLFLSFYLQSS